MRRIVLITALATALAVPATAAMVASKTTATPNAAPFDLSQVLRLSDFEMQHGGHLPTSLSGLAWTFEAIAR